MRVIDPLKNEVFYLIFIFNIFFITDFSTRSLDSLCYLADVEKLHFFDTIRLEVI
jgi:hypothetical protein